MPVLFSALPCLGRGFDQKNRMGKADYRDIVRSLDTAQVWCFPARVLLGALSPEALERIYVIKPGYAFWLPVFADVERGSKALKALQHKFAAADHG